MSSGGAGRKLGGVFLILFGLPFLGVGVLVMGSLCKQLVAQGRAGGWEQVPARIESVKLNEGPGSEGNPGYSVICRYSYEYAGRQYSGSRVSPDLGGSGDSRRERFDLLERHRAEGRPFPAWVNPRDPAESMLFRQAASSWLLLVFALVFGGAGALFATLGILRFRPPRPRGEPWKFGPALEFIVLIAVGVPFVGVGILTLGIFGKQWMDQGRVDGWERVPVLIESAQLREFPGRNVVAVYVVECRYSYEYGGVHYAGSRVYPDYSGSSDPRHRERFESIERHRASGRPFSAWVNPHNPAESVLFGKVTELPWALLPFGICFAGAGLFVMGKGVRGYRDWRRRTRLLARDPGHPWRADRRWAGGFVFDSHVAANLAGQWTATVFLAIFMSMFVYLVGTQGGPGWVRIVVGFFVLCALALLGHSVYRTVQLAKYGSPRLALEELPAVPGRTLTAIVLCRRHVDLAGDFTVTLQCNRTTGSGKQRRTETIGKWTIKVPHDRDLARERGGTAIPVVMPVPDELPDTTWSEEYTAINWKLVVRADAPGVDFKAEFDIPVFRVENESLIEKRPTSNPVVSA